MPSESYVREKLTVAVDSLAGSGPLHERMRSALLSLTRLQPEDFDDSDDRAEWAAILDALTEREALADEGTIMATVFVMSDEELQVYVDRITRLARRYPLELD